jgi:hypothetical protein
LIWNPMNGAYFTQQIDITNASFITLIAASSTAVCEGTQVQLTASSPDNLTSTFLWSTTETTNSISVLPTVPSSQYSVSVTHNSCTAVAIIDITVNPIPSAPTVVSPVTYCQNETASALTATGTDLLWYTLPAGGTGSSIAPTPITTVAGTVSYYVSQTINGCESATSQIDVITNPIPAAPTVTTPVNYCIGATVSALTAIGTDLLWYTVPTGGTGSSTAPTPLSTVAGTVSYYVSQTINGCESVRSQIDVITNPFPAAPTVTSPVNYCIGATASALTATGTDLLWYTLPAGGTGSSIAPTPITTVAGTVSYYVSQTINGCESALTAIQVNVNPPFTPTFNITTTLLLNSIPPNLPLTSNNNITGTWNHSQINTSSIGTTTYTFTPDPWQCASVTTITVEVIDVPQACIPNQGTIVIPDGSSA